MNIAVVGAGYVGLITGIGFAKLNHQVSIIDLNNDLIGTQLGGALKNVIAIACGIADANELGEGARSAIITRGFSEIRQIGKTFGCKIETLFGLSCLGDLTLTCNSKLSRNYNFGLKIGKNLKNNNYLLNPY